MSKEKILSVDEILEAPDIITSQVYIREWGGSVKLRNLSAAEAIDFVRQHKDDKEGASAVEIVALCAIDENGERLFTKEKVQELKKKSFRAILKLQDEAMRINGMKEDSLEEAKND